MNLKPLYITTGILAFLAGVTYIANNGDDSTDIDPRVGHTINDISDLGDVRKIELRSEGETMTFQYSDESKKWLVAESHNLPVAMNRFNEIVNTVTDARIERVASSSPERISTFGFADDSIRFIAEDGTAKLDLDIGRETDSGKQIIRFGDEPKAYLVNTTFTVSGNPIDWLDKKLVSYDQADLRAAKLTLADGSEIEVSRASAEEDWQASSQLPDGKQIDQAALSRAISRFANANFTKLAAKELPEVAAARDNSSKFLLTFADESTLDITVGRQPEVKVMKEVETENDAGERVTEMQEVVETPTGPVYLFAESSDAANPLNGYMEKTAFEIAAYQFTSLPGTLEAILQDIPEVEPEPEAIEEPIIGPQLPETK